MTYDEDGFGPDDVMTLANVSRETSGLEFGPGSDAIGDADPE